MRWLLPLLFLPALGWAAPSVGPLDGAKAPSLPAVAMPVLGYEEELPNTALPKALEAKGLLAAATLEWARIAEEARGPERAEAFYNLAALSFRQQQPVAGAAYLAEWQALNPNSPSPEAVLLAQLEAVEGASRTAVLHQLQTDYPTSQGSVAARWQAVWQQAAATGRVRQDWGLDTAATLEARLKFLRTKALTQYTLAVGLAVLPGAGHLLLQQWAMAAVLLLGWGLFGLAFLSACRHRHYAYALVWAVPFVALWLNSPLLAAQAAEAQAQQARWQAMAGWQDLRPSVPSAK